MMFGKGRGNAVPSTSRYLSTCGIMECACATDASLMVEGFKLQTQFFDLLKTQSSFRFTILAFLVTQLYSFSGTSTFDDV